MGFSLKWIVPEQLLQVRVWGQVTLKEFSQLNHAVIDCFDTSEAHNIHILLDERHIDEVQGSLFELQEVAAMLYHPKAGWWLMIGEGEPHMNYLYSTITRLEKVEYHRFDDLATAAAFLIETTPELLEAMPLTA